MANSGVEEEQRIEGKEIPGKGEREMGNSERKLLLLLQRGGLLKFCSRNQQIQSGGNSFLGSLLFGSLGTGS